jgi:hypothetical protein
MSHWEMEKKVRDGDCQPNSLSRIKKKSFVTGVTVNHGIDPILKKF